MIRIISIFLCFIFFSYTSLAQLREIPAGVKETFSSQYPGAESVEYKDHLKDVHVAFTLDSAKYRAKYSNKGAWKETEREWNFTQLSGSVKDGFDKSKYADWQVKETAIIYLPGGGERFRLKVEKSDLQKKYLFFNKNGRLVRDAITI